MAKDKILVLSVDRDNDLGTKTRFKGPVTGREAVLSAANALGLADPEDSDFNAMFQAIRMFDEVKKQFPSQIALLTGDRDVGIKSDKEISDQLSRILKKFPATGAIFISDGTEDEQIMPIIQSRVPIISVKRVIVKQSEQLETGYYKIKDFIKESLDNPKFSRLVFGLPAIILILLGIFGLEGFRVVIGLLGAYLLIKGFKLENYFIAAAEEVSTALTRRRFVFFLYVMTAVFFALASYRGYLGILEAIETGIFEIIAGFLSASVFFFFLSGTLAWIGRSIRVEDRSIKKVVSVTIFGFSIAWVVFNSAELILRPEISAFNFILSIVLGFILIFIALLIEWKA